MRDAEPKGCLSAILSLFGINLGGPVIPGGPVIIGSELPFRLRDDFLSAAELSFYRVLLNAVGNRAIVCPKVNLADIFLVVRPNENQGFRNKIDRKHVDFLLCAPTTMKPRCAIELDDSSHARLDRQDRDKFVDQVFEIAGLPLVRVPAKAAYSPAGLLTMIGPHLDDSPGARLTVPANQSTEFPLCPKCGVPMVERLAKKGQNAGQSFLGCPNYPKCWEIVQRV